MSRRANLRVVPFHCCGLSGRIRPIAASKKLRKQTSTQLVQGRLVDLPAGCLFRATGYSWCQPQIFYFIKSSALNTNCASSNRLFLSKGPQNLRSSRDTAYAIFAKGSSTPCCRTTSSRPDNASSFGMP